MNTHNTFIYGELRKIILTLSSNTLLYTCFFVGTKIYLHVGYRGTDIKVVFDDNLEISLYISQKNRDHNIGFYGEM